MLSLFQVPSRQERLNDPVSDFVDVIETQRSLLARSFRRLRQALAENETGQFWKGQDYENPRVKAAVRQLEEDCKDFLSLCYVASGASILRADSLVLTKPSGEQSDEKLEGAGSVMLSLDFDERTIYSGLVRDGFIRCASEDERERIAGLAAQEIERFTEEYGIELSIQTSEGETLGALASPSALGNVQVEPQAGSRLRQTTESHPVCGRANHRTR